MSTYIKYATDGSIESCSNWPFPDSVKVNFDIVRGHDGKLYKADEAPEKPADIVLGEQQALYINAVQERLDDFAKTRGYDNIMSTCSYFGSANPRFKAEANRAIALRDATWAKCYEILAAVQSGKREVPTLDALFGELPVLTWE